MDHYFGCCLHVTDMADLDFGATLSCLLTRLPNPPDATSIWGLLMMDGRQLPLVCAPSGLCVESGYGHWSYRDCVQALMWSKLLFICSVIGVSRCLCVS